MPWYVYSFSVCDWYSKKVLQNLIVHLISILSLLFLLNHPFKSSEHHQAVEASIQYDQRTTVTVAMEKNKITSPLLFRPTLSFTPLASAASVGTPVLIHFTLLAREWSNIVLVIFCASFFVWIAVVLEQTTLEFGCIAICDKFLQFKNSSHYWQNYWGTNQIQ